MSAPDRRHIPEFDGMRGLAISAVMLYHLWFYKGDSAVGRGVSEVFKIGWAGVDVFFVLSGFLITGILLDTRESPHYWRNFYVRRSLRIFPLYYAVMIAIVGVGVLASVLGLPLRDPALEAVDRAWINFLYLTNFAYAIHGKDYVPLDIAWSLAIEEQFYLVFPLFVWFADRRALRKGLLAAVVLAPVLRVAWFVWSGGRMEGPYVLPFCRMDTLALGGLTALTLRDGSDRFREQVATAALVLVPLALAALVLGDRRELTFVGLGYSVVALAAAAAVVRVLVSRQRFEARVLRLPALVFVGKISYGLYLLHLVARAAVDQGLLRSSVKAFTHDPVLAAVRVAISFTLAVALASASFYLFERPLLRLKDRFAPDDAKPRGAP